MNSRLEFLALESLFCLIIVSLCLTASWFLIQQQLVLLHKDPTVIRNDVVLLDHQVVLIHKGHTPFGYQFI